MSTPRPGMNLRRLGGTTEAFRSRFESRRLQARDIRRKARQALRRPTPRGPGCSSRPLPRPQRKGCGDPTRARSEASA